MPGEDDWRLLRRQDEYLLGATLQRKRYEKDDHDHCEFCWKKFMSPAFSAERAQLISSHPEILTEGYAVQGGRTIEGTKDDYWWICPACVHDFSDRFRWIVLEAPTGG